MIQELGPTLVTSRLRLRVPTEADADFALRMYSRSEVVRFIGSGDPDLSREQAAQRMMRYRSRFGPATGVWLIESRASATPWGFALLKPIPLSEGLEEAHYETEIGWHLHPDAWGSGLASEAGRALLDHARAQGISRLVAVTHPENKASQAVAERIGMTREGLTGRYYGTTCELFTLNL